MEKCIRRLLKIYCNHPPRACIFTFRIFCSQVRLPIIIFQRLALHKEKAQLQPSEIFDSYYINCLAMRTDKRAMVQVTSGSPALEERRVTWNMNVSCGKTLIGFCFESSIVTELLRPSCYHSCGQPDQIKFDASSSGNKSRQ